MKYEALKTYMKKKTGKEKLGTYDIFFSAAFSLHISLVGTFFVIRLPYFVSDPISEWQT